MLLMAGNMLNQNESSILQIEDINNIRPEQISSLKEKGICYFNVKNLPFNIDEEFICLSNYMAIFFKQENRIKKYYGVDNYKIAEGDRSSSGYRDRRSAMEHLEMFHQNLGEEINPILQDKAEIIEASRALFANSITINLLEKLVGSVQDNCTNKEHIKQMIEHLYAVQTYIFYPNRSLAERMTLRPRFNPHRDNDLLTFIMLDKPGLKFWLDGAWQDVLPKPGYCVLLIGDLLNYISQGKIQACLHMVDTSDNEDRLSIITFISSKKSTPLHLNTKAHAIVLNDPNHNKRIYDYNFTDRIIFKKIYSTLRNKLNLSHLVFLGLFLLKDTTIENRVINAASFKSNSLKWSLASLFLTNTLMQIFRMTYFETMLMDYLYHFDYPNYTSQEQVKAHNLGMSTFSLRGIINSITFFVSSGAKSTSFWNAGFVSKCVEYEKKLAVSSK